MNLFRTRLGAFAAFACALSHWSAAAGVPATPPSLAGIPASAIEWRSVADITPVPGAILTRTTASASNAAVARDSTIHPPGLTRYEPAGNGTARWLEGSLGWIALPGTTMKTAAAPGALGAQIASALVPWARPLGLRNPAAELRLNSIQTDERGWQHVRFDQVFNGLRVWAKDLYVHVTGAGEIRIVNGAFVPTPVGVDTVPSITGTEASETAKGDFQAHGHWNPVDARTAQVLGYQDEAPELVIYASGAIPVLAWAVGVRPNLLEWWTVFVDAHTGAIVHRSPQFCDAGFTNATATDLNGVTQSFRSWQSTTGTYFLFWDLPNYNAGASNLPDTMAGGIQTMDLRGHDAVQTSTIFYVTSANNAWTDPSSVSAHYNGRVAYDYYHNTFARKAIDDKDSTIASIIHVTSNGAPMDNAYWNGKAMFYGDGDTAFKPLAGGLDVAGHEMTHGVTGNSANLVYENQSGALNESMSDVFAVMIDTANFLIGETIMKPGQGIALRDLQNPDNPNVLSPQPARMADYVFTGSDNGGVHTNSGIPNRAAYLVINAIGRDKTQRIYYRALTMYLTRSSQFADCRDALVQAATDLYGATEIAAVKSAFDSVGVRTAVPPPTGTGTVPPVTGGSPLVTWVENDGTIGILDPVAVTYGTYSNAKVRVDIPNDDRAQVSTPLDGSTIYFVNQTGHLAFIKLDTNQLFTYPNLHITTDGDLWNACVSPDGAFVSIISSNRTDRSLYVLSLRNGFLGHIILDLQASDGGATDTSILFADVTSWSPNMGFPRIGFDALHQTTVNGVTSQYYGMGEINFTTNRIYDLVPGQTSDVSVGNITYSNTNPNLIAYNTITSILTSTFVDIVISNDGDAVAQNIGTYTLNAQFITDPFRPTFSPDDSQICFSVPSMNALCFFNPTTKALGALTFPFSVYNPRWFSKGAIAPYTFQDVRVALAIASGSVAATPADKARLNLIDTGTSAGKVTMEDAVRIARKVTGVSP